MDVGPNAQAVVDALAERPAAVIAATEDYVQGVFRALFNGAMTPGTFNGSGRLDVRHPDANEGWPSAWNALADLGLLAYRIVPHKAKLVATGISVNAWATLHWQITALGWTVRIDDVAWMVEFMAAQEADKATRQ